MKTHELIWEICKELERKLCLYDRQWIEVSVADNDGLMRVSTLLVTYKYSCIDRQFTYELFSDHLPHTTWTESSSLKDALEKTLDAVKAYNPVKVCECCGQDMPNSG